VVAGAAFLIFTSPAKAEIFFLQVAGAIFVTSGLVFAIWARMTLGKYWSGFIDPSSNSRLVTKGPYRYVRHPIYVGLLIALLGTAIQMNQGEFWVAYIGVTVTYIVKLKFEEKKLLVAFGDEYRKYMQNTW